GLLPPCALVARAMHRTMMPAAEWDRKLIADLAAERTRLHEAEVVRVRGLAAAHKARLLGDIAKVLAVAVATRSGDCEETFVDASGLLMSGKWVLRHLYGCGTLLC